MSARLRRASDALRELDVDIDFDRVGHGGDRPIRIVWHPPTVGNRGGKDNVVPLRPQQPTNDSATQAPSADDAADVPGAS